MPPALIFDLDGTLVDSLPGIAAALNAALAEHDLSPHDTDAVRGFVGSGSYMLCRRAIPDREPDDLARRVEHGFKRHYADHWQDGTTLFPGIDALIERLSSTSRRLAVLSNKPDAFTREMVDHLFPRQPFSLVRGQIDGSPRKPDPGAVRPLLDRWQTDPGACRLIGDSEVDLETAEAAGIPFIGVAWGYRPADILGPSVVDSVTALEALLTLD